ILDFRTEGADEGRKQRSHKDRGDNEGQLQRTNVNSFDAIHVMTCLYKPLNRSCSQTQTNRASGSREDQALEHSLTHDAQPAAAQCNSNRNFLSPRSDPGDQEAGDIHARNEEDTSGSGEQSVQGRFVVLNRVVKQGTTDDGAMDGRSGMLRLDLLLNSLELAD